MLQGAFLRILSSAINSATSVPPSLSALEQLRILELAELHKVLPLVYDTMHSCGFCLPQNDQIPKRVRFLVSQQTLRTHIFSQIYQTLLQQGVTPVVVKGLICRVLYPNPDLRISSDEDLLILPEEYPLCTELLTDMEFCSVGEKSPDHYQHTFVNNQGIRLEIHTSLFDTKDPFFSNWNRMFDGYLHNTVSISAENQKYLSLDPTLHLLYLVLHSLKHFIHSGVGIRQVCDIVLFANRYSDEINWQVFSEKCTELGAIKFAMGIFAIGKKHLNLNNDVSDTLSQYAAFPKDEGPLLQDILDAGIYGSSTLSRQHSSTITFSSAKNRHKGLLRRLFPGAKSLDSRYAYAKKTPLLLPVAWIHRLFVYRKEVKKFDNNNPLDSVRIGKKRVKLLNEYGLIKNKQTLHK